MPLRLDHPGLATARPISYPDRSLRNTGDRAQQGSRMADGRIFQINASGGGVPKTPLVEAQVETNGLTTDAQAHPDIHGGPRRALCLYSLERITALQDEGHPVFPGAAGENLTLRGLDWDAVVPGVKMRLGREVEIEVLSYTQPCRTIRDYFDGRDSRRIAQERHPGWSRVYAQVLRNGTIRTGDVVTLLPAGEGEGR